MDQLSLDVIGRELFGRAARLRLAMWVAQTDSVFWQQQAATGAAVRPQYIRPELDRLARLGMIQPVDRNDPGETRNFYQRVDHPLWDVIEEAARAIAKRCGYVNGVQG